MRACGERGVSLKASYVYRAARENQEGNTVYSTKGHFGLSVKRSQKPEYGHCCCDNGRSVRLTQPPQWNPTRPALQVRSKRGYPSRLPITMSIPQICIARMLRSRRT